jgi:hypothetical protein
MIQKHDDILCRVGPFQLTEVKYLVAILVVRLFVRECETVKQASLIKSDEDNPIITCKISSFKQSDRYLHQGILRRSAFIL